MSEVFVFPASFAQQRLWFLDRLVPGSAFYNMPAVVPVSEPFDLEALRLTLHGIVTRHESLRTTFAVVDDVPVQVVAEHIDVLLAVTDLSSLEAPARDAERRRLTAEEAARPFDLTRGPLLRAAVLRLGTDGDVLLLTLHHIISDRWSMDVLFRELSACYASFVTGKPRDLPDLAVQYADYAVWQRQWLQGGVIERQLDYWRTCLKAAPASLDLPTDRPRPVLAPLRAATRPVQWTADISRQVRELAQRERSTPFLVLFTAFATLLARYSAQHDIVVGTPVAGRAATEVEPLIGFFVNTLPLRLNLSGDPTFRELLERARGVASDALANQDVPFEHLVAELAPERAVNRSPLFQVMFAVQSATEDARPPRSGEAHRDDGSWDAVAGAAKFDLTVSLTDHAAEIAGWVEYAADLFDRATIERMLDNFERLVRDAVARPDARISALAMLSPAERTRLVDEWNATAHDYPRTRTVHHLFEEQVDAAPGEIAAIYGDRSMTYGELNARSNRLARRLAALGIGRDCLVGVLMSPSIEMIVSFVAILKAGGAYVPLDPGDPAARLRFMLRDAEARVVLTSGVHASMVRELGANAAVVELDAGGDRMTAADSTNLHLDVRPNDLAYVIYTSGSTGEPKGVAVEHRAIVRLVRNTNYVDFLPRAVFAQMSHPAFDAATFEIWGALLSGSRLVGIPRETALAPRALSAAIRERGVTTLFITTTLFNQVAREAPDAFRGIRDLLTGGEANDARAMQRVLERSRPSRLLHVYGPTESTTFTTWHHVTAVSDEVTNVPIGRPLANTRVYVLDEYGQVVPTGAPGELCIGGDGVARGYWRRPDLTADRFVPDPFSDDTRARLYRTGDLVRYRSDGALLFLGRRDEQVKIRGFRVEPGEVESVLRSHPSVRDAAVVVREDAATQKELIAYLVAEDAGQPPPFDSPLRAFVQQRLPAWMAPARFTWVEALPLTPSGKVDRRALLQTAGRQLVEMPLEEPSTPTEREVAEIWQELLARPAVGAADRFFDIGGHSLLAAQVVARVRDRLGVDVPVGALFTTPSLRDFAAAVDGERLRSGMAAARTTPALVHRETAGPRQASFAQQRLWFIAQLEPDSPVYNVPDVIELGGASEAIVGRAVSVIVQRHDILRTVFVPVDGIPMQVVDTHRDAPLPYDDLRPLAATERDEAYADARKEMAHQPIDLAQAPLFRARLIRLADDDLRLLVTFHHAIADAWSLQVLRGELHALVEAFSQGGPSQLSELPIQYADYSDWQRARLAGEELERLLAYWRTHLAGAPTTLQLPSDHPRPPVQTYAGAMLSTRVPDEVYRELRSLSSRQETTLFTTVLAAFAVLLARYSGQRDLVVGTPVAGRTHTALEPLIGLFVNTLALRIDLREDPSFVQLLETVRRTVIDGLAHQDLPFDRLVAELAPIRNPGVSPLIQVLFDFQRRVDERLRISAAEVVATRPSVAKFDLTLVTTEDADGLVASLEYNTDLFDSAAARRILQNLVRLLAAIAEDPARACSRFDGLTEEERHLILGEWSGGAAAPDGDPDLCVPALVARTIHEHGDRVSVVTGGGELTYAALDRAAANLGPRLCRVGLTVEEPVGLYFERSPGFVIGCLGILKAGAAYVPLDPSHPLDRIRDILRDAGVRVVLTDRRRAELLSLPAKILTLDDEQEGEGAIDGCSTCRGDSLAAVFFTSGSTGRPKGVALEHHALANLAVAIARAYELTPDDRVLQMSAVAFDVAAEEVFPTLTAGAALVPWTERAAPAIDELLGFVDRYRVTVLNLPSPYWHALTDALAEGGRHLPPSVRLVIAGSDRTSMDRLLAWQHHVDGRVRWLNAYGTTEAAVTSALYEPQVPARRGSTPWVPIGRPISGVRTYVLDEHLRPVPAGAPGELFIGGAGVARGYIGRTEATVERFIADPFTDVPGARLYRTGDRARVRGDGNLELLGRLDDQIKIRGFRIEPAEIERWLAQHPGVRDAAIVPREGESGTARLVGYIVPRHLPGPSPAELHAHLQRHLPEYMIPHAFVPLTELPTTSAGKVDRERLPVPVGNADADRPYVPPRTAAERQLAQVWAQVLGVERVGVTDNFFELGGDSILSIQIIARAAQLGLRYTPRQMFEHQTIAQLAPLAGTGTSIVAEQGYVTGPAPLTPVQRWFLEHTPVDAHHYNQSVLLELAAAADPELLRRAFEELIDRHDALRLRFAFERDRVRQAHAAPGGAAFSVLDLRDVPQDERNEAFAEAVERCQAGLDLVSGPIARALFVRLERSSRLLIVVHHLAVDGVSWRVILDDLYAAYDQLARGETVVLPPKTTSFQHWARRLVEYTDSPALRAEVQFWQSLSQHALHPLPRDFAARPEDNTEASARVLSVTLDASETDALLHRVPHTYRTQINDVLLCAMARGFRTWTGRRELLVDLEGHGREPLFDDVDLSRTVGWFTTIFPVVVDAGDEGAPGAALKQVKESLRQVPNKGIGFGVLRYLSADAAARRALEAVPRPEVSFNYLGQFEDTASALGAPKFAEEWGGPQRSPQAQRHYLLDVTAGVHDRRLTLSCMYSAACHRRETIEALAGAVAHMLRELIRHCLAADRPECTPSDFPLASVDAPLLDRLVAAHGAIEDIYPLSPMQQGMLFHTLLAPAAGEYVELIVLDLDPELDIGALERAWATVIERHPVLRSAFVWYDVPEPLQVVRRAAPLPWEVSDWSADEEQAVRARTEEWLRRDRRMGYDLAVPPLMRFAVVKLPSRRWRFFWSCHHVVLDGWSVPLLLREVSHFYDAFSSGRDAELAHPRPYRDYIAWLASQDLGAAEDFWRGVLRGFSTPTPLVVDRPRTGVAGSDTHDERRLTLTRESTAALQGLGREYRVTLNTIVQGVWGLLLARYADVDDVVFGATVSGRPPELTGVEAMVGLFINTLPVRVRTSPDVPVAELLQALQTQQAAARRFEYTPLVSVQAWSDVPRGTPLFESVLVFENYPVSSQAAAPDDGERLLRLPALERTSYPLTIAVVPGAQLTIKITFDCARFDRGAVERMLGHFESMLTALSAAPNATVASLPLLTARELEHAVRTRNRTQSDVPCATCIHMFDEQVRRTPDAAAVACGSVSLSYAELNEQANAVASYLRAQDVDTDVPVAVYLERGPRLAVAVLAILKARGAYVPLATSYPAERIRFMLQDSGARVVLTEAALSDRISSSAGTVACLDSDHTIIAAARSCDLPLPEPHGLAYIIYTSGSTGQPKGAPLPHRALANLIWWQNTCSTPRRSPRVLQFAPVSFDVWFQECFSTWAAGGTLVLVTEDEHRDPRLLAQAIDRYRVDRVFLPFVALQQLAEHANDTGAARGLNEVITAGEQLQVTPALRRFFTDRPACVLHNQYGPSETHVTTAFCLDGDPAAWPDLPPIGWPIANTEVYVLDSARRPVPVGVPGELYLGGVCLAREYWRRPDLTAERFVPHPFVDDPDARLYRTGDLVRVALNDAIEFLGRRDEQVKIRGFRVEPGEVEAVLRRHPSVWQAAVVATGELSADRRLVAYIVPAPGDVGSVSDSDLREHIEQALPDWMVPAAFVRLDSLPLTPSGKVNRRALPAVDHAPEMPPHQVEPRTSAERALIDIWKDVLGTATVSLHDHFFQLGGHSLLATRLVGRVRKDLGIELPLRSVFENPVLADLARCLGDADQTLASPAPIPRRSVAGPVAASFGQQRLWLLEQVNRRTVFHIGAAMPVSGSVPDDVWVRALHEVVRRHDVLRTTFVAVDGVPVQQVAREVQIPLRNDDLRAAPAPRARVLCRELAAADQDEPFDLAAGPLLRARLVKITDNESELLVTLHHIVADGWSLSILQRELLAVADAFASGRAPSLPPLPIQYADFAMWQRERLRGPALEADVEYWRRQLAGTPPILDFPTDRPRPPLMEHKGAMLRSRIGADLATGLRAFSQRDGVTLFMTLLSAFAILLSRQTGQRDLVIGAPVAGRTRPETEPLIGFFLNHLPIRVDVAGAPSFRELVARVRDTALEAYAHQDLPFELLLEHLAVERNPSCTPVFQTFFNMLNFGDRIESGVAAADGRNLGEADVKEAVATWSPFDFTLYAAEEADGIDLQLVYRTALFDEERMVELLRQLLTVLAQAVADPSRPVQDFTLVTDVSRRRLPDPSAPLGDTWRGAVHMQFARQAAEHPDRIAVSDDDVTWTYAALDAYSSGIAQQLRADRIAADEVVAIYAHRSAPLVCAILGVMKAGASYVILDPGYPPARLLQYVEAAQPVAAIALEAAGPVPEELDAWFGGSQCRTRIVLPRGSDVSFAADTDSPVPLDPVGPDRLACISFTSGSSGTPKGVLQRHGPLTHFVPWLAETFALSHQDRFSMLSGLSHDPLQRDIFTPLCLGASIHVPAMDTIGTPGELAAWLRTTRITVAHMTPAVGQLLATDSLSAGRDAAHIDSPDLHVVFFMGDKVTRSDVIRVRQFAPAATCVAFYGATETQRAVGCFVDRPDGIASQDRGGAPEARDVLPAGRGIPDVQLLLITPSGQLAGIGELAEIHVRSPHLALGYHRDVELTRTRFVPNPFTGADEDTLYRTGDLGRYLPNGLVEFAGRSDLQIKVRGFRVELPEIEAQLRRHPRVRDVAVAARGSLSTDTRIVAYVVPDDTVSPAELRHFTAARLPNYMIPSAFVLLDTLPLTPNGKLDLQRLPEGETHADAHAVRRRPGNAIEAAVLSLWRQALNAKEVGVDDNFFELGGHSLLASQVLARIADAFRVNLTLGQLFQHPTIAGLAHLVTAAQTEGALSTRPPITPISREEHRARRDAAGTLVIPAPLRQALRKITGGRGATSTGRRRMPAEPLAGARQHLQGDVS